MGSAFLRSLPGVWSCNWGMWGEGQIISPRPRESLELGYSQKIDRWEQQSQSSFPLQLGSSRMRSHYKLSVVSWDLVYVYAETNCRGGKPHLLKILRFRFATN